MKLQELADRWPQELTRANGGLNSEFRRSIFVFLLQNERSYSFSELADELGIRPDLLSYHLSKLLSSGLLEHTLERREGTRDHSFYFVSEFGKNYADKQLEVVEELWATIRPTKISNFAYLTSYFESAGSSYDLLRKLSRDYLAASHYFSMSASADSLSELSTEKPDFAAAMKSFAIRAEEYHRSRPKRRIPELVTAD